MNDHLKSYTAQNGIQTKNQRHWTTTALANFVLYDVHSNPAQGMKCFIMIISHLTVYFSSSLLQRYC